MKRKPVKSSNITSVGYDADKLILEVEFNSGKIYQYSPITNEGYIEMLKADSVGKFFLQHIRGNNTLTVDKIE